MVSTYDNSENSHRSLATGGDAHHQGVTGCRVLSVKHELIFLVQLFALVPFPCFYYPTVFLSTWSVAATVSFEFWKRETRRAAGKSHFPRTLALWEAGATGKVGRFIMHFLLLQVERASRCYTAHVSEIWPNQCGTDSRTRFRKKRMTTVDTFSAIPFWEYVCVRTDITSDNIINDFP